MKSNQLLKTLKDGDIVLMVLPGLYEPSVLEICQLKNTKFIPKGEGRSFDRLDFDSDTLYVNTRVHSSQLGESAGNCLSITEVIAPEHLEQFARNKDMWKASLYQYSDVEYKHAQSTAESSIKLWDRD